MRKNWALKGKVKEKIRTGINGFRKVGLGRALGMESLW